MKRIVLAPLVLLAVIVSCKKTEVVPLEKEPETEIAAEATQRSCPSPELLEEQLQKDPDMRNRRMALEEATRNFVLNKESSRLVNGVLEIPVVVNVLYR